MESVATKNTDFSPASNRIISLLKFGYNTTKWSCKESNFSEKFSRLHTRFEHIKIKRDIARFSTGLNGEIAGKLFSIIFKQ